MKFFLFPPMLFCQLLLLAQTENVRSPLSFSGYVETYYGYDFGNPADHNRPAFLYSFNRHNEVNLNLGFVKATYSKEILRSNLALMAGTYPNANLNAEPGVLRNILEANAGIKISKSKNLWIDAGVFGSHIGFESAIGKDCWNLTRSLSAENSPYYESGLKIGYTTDNGNWFVSLLFLNGWQRIQRVAGNNTPAFGHQLSYKHNDKVTLNSSSFIGNDKPDTVRQMRYFHDLYAIFQISPELAITAGLDFGMEQTAKSSREYNTWYTPVLIFRYAATPKTSIALRGEFYRDKHGSIISTGTHNGLQTWGYSANVDYNVRENLIWRVEARGFNSKDAIFSNTGISAQDNFMLATALAIWF